LRLGAAFDWLNIDSDNVTFPGGAGPVGKIDGEAWTVAGYVSYQATEKLSVHLRGEYAEARLDEPGGVLARDHQGIFALTTTAQYDLWKNVMTRVEFRWDHSTSGDDIFGGATPASSPTLKNAFVLAANVIYKF
jgi:predicted porin